jgi:hypothetical protein
MNNSSNLLRLIGTNPLGLFICIPDDWGYIYLDLTQDVLDTIQKFIKIMNENNDVLNMALNFPQLKARYLPYDTTDTNPLLVKLCHQEYEYPCFLNGTDGVEFNSADEYWSADQGQIEVHREGIRALGIHREGEYKSFIIPYEVWDKIYHK